MFRVGGSCNFPILCAHFLYYIIKLKITNIDLFNVVKNIIQLFEMPFMLNNMYYIYKCCRYMQMTNVFVEYFPKYIQKKMVRNIFSQWS